MVVIGAEEATIRLAEEGYCVLEGLLDPAEADRLAELSRPWMKMPEPKFYHLGGALNDVPQLAPLCIHPTILEITEHELGEGFILANNVDVTLHRTRRAGAVAARRRSVVVDASTVARISNRIAGVLDAHGLHAG